MPKATPCHDCGLGDVAWVVGRGGTLRHDGGNASCRFPCKRCNHIDCAEARGTDDLIATASRLSIGVVNSDGARLTTPIEEDTTMGMKPRKKPQTAATLDSLINGPLKKDAARRKTATKSATKATSGSKPAAKKAPAAKAPGEKRAAAKRLSPGEKEKALAKAIATGDIPKSKTCPRCSPEKKLPAAKFHTFHNKAGKLVLTGYCKGCYSAYNRERREAAA